MKVTSLAYEKACSLYNVGAVEASLGNQQWADAAVRLLCRNHTLAATTRRLLHAGSLSTQGRSTWG